MVYLQQTTELIPRRYALCAVLDVFWYWCMVQLYRGMARTKVHVMGRWAVERQTNISIGSCSLMSFQWFRAWNWTMAKCLLLLLIHVSTIIIILYYPGYYERATALLYYNTLSTSFLVESSMSHGIAFLMTGINPTPPTSVGQGISRANLRRY
jgi:hypothetical protein